MATTTPNFGWVVPTSSDLVKNGAVAIETLGDSIDASMVDLKGGTTGQVLSKTSATDMDFTWIAPSAGSTNVAGKNLCLNSNYSIWQRGTSFSVSSAGTYTADRWQAYRSTSSTSTVSRQLTGDTTNLPFIQYCARVQRDSGNTLTQTILFVNSSESINSIPFAGKTVTFSFYARAGANFSAASSQLAVQLQTGTGTDQNALMTGYTGLVNAVNSTATLTTTWQRFTYTATLGATITEIAPYFTFTPTGTAGANDYYEITGVQIEVASSATAYSPNTSTQALELAACQRYYRKSYQQGTAPATATTGPGLIVTPAAATVANQDNYGSVQFDTKMRTAPTVTIYPYTTPTNTARVSNGAGTDLAAASGTVVLTSDSGFYSKNNSGGAVLSSLGVILYHYTADAEL